MFWPKITLFGDSITRRSKDAETGCWGSMIGHRVGSFWDLDARGFEGYNTRWALELLSKLFPKVYLDFVDVLVIFFGHNDSWEVSSVQHVPVEEYERNMKAIIQYFVDNGLNKDKIIVVSPGWYHGEDWANYRKSTGKPFKGKELAEAEKYCEAALRVAREESIDVVDFFVKTIQHQPLGELFCDGLHLSTKGAQLLYDSLMPVIERKLESQYGKPLDDLWHVTPMSEKPEVKEAEQRGGN